MYNTGQLMLAMFALLHSWSLRMQLHPIDRDPKFKSCKDKMKRKQQTHNNQKSWLRESGQGWIKTWSFPVFSYLRNAFQENNYRLRTRYINFIYQLHEVLYPTTWYILRYIE